MTARKITVQLFALALGLTFAGFAGAASDAPATDTPKAAEKACCKHHDSADGKAGMHCDHAKMKAAGEKGEACCAQHAKMHKDGAGAKAGCAHHAEMKEGEATVDGKAGCAQHAAMHKDGDKSGCCCCGAGEACPHHPAEEAPAKS